MIAQPQIHVRFPRGTGSGSVANQSIGNRQTESTSWRDVSDLSPIEGQVQVFTCVHRNFFTHVMSQALRNAGQGTAVLIVQFFKGGIGQGPDNPTHLSQNLDWVRCRLSHSINQAPEQAEEREAVLELWEFVQDAIESGRYEQVILEELSLAVFHGIIPEAEVLELLKHRPRHVDIVLMGQQMSEALIETADQVTKLRNLFHVPPEAIAFEAAPLEKLPLATTAASVASTPFPSAKESPASPGVPIAQDILKDPLAPTNGEKRCQVTLPTPSAKRSASRRKPGDSKGDPSSEGNQGSKECQQAETGASPQDLPVLPGQLRIPGID